MSISTFKKKYPLTQWVLSADDLKPNDVIAFWDDSINREMHGKFVRTSDRHTIVLNVGVMCALFKHVDFYRTICFKIEDAEVGDPTKCKCTSYELVQFGCRCGYVTHIKTKSSKDERDGL